MNISGAGKAMLVGLLVGALAKLSWLLLQPYMPASF
jgi:hypothetical protein